MVCWRVCLPTVTYNWFQVILCKSWRVPHVGQEMLTLSGTPDFTPFGEFMISPIHYICIICYWICQFSDYVYGLMTALSLDLLYCITIKKVHVDLRIYYYMNKYAMKPRRMTILYADKMPKNMLTTYTRRFSTLLGSFAELIWDKRCSNLAATFAKIYFESLCRWHEFSIERNHSI